MNLRSFLRSFTLTAVIIAVLAGLSTDAVAKKNKSRSRKSTYTTQSVKSNKSIIIDKKKFTLSVMDGDKCVASYPVCVAVNKGQKTRRGDHKTPEGDFKIISIENSSGWKHDFKDGAGQRKGAYGPWFFRLNCKVSPHIGIHGTCFPESTGKRASDGCVRLRNEDLLELKKHVYCGMPVKILPD